MRREPRWPRYRPVLTLRLRARCDRVNSVLSLVAVGEHTTGAGVVTVAGTTGASVTTPKLNWAGWSRELQNDRWRAIRSVSRAVCTLQRPGC